MEKQWKREWKLVIHSFSHICFWTVFTAFGGILLWVHGSAALVYRTGLLPDCMPSFLVCFLLWLVVYALAGCELGFLLLPTCFRAHVGKQEGLLCLLIYLLTLIWYPLFFSLLHRLLCTLTLGMAVLLQFWLLFCAIRRCSVITLPHFLSCLLEIYFLCVTFASLLLD